MFAKLAAVVALSFGLLVAAQDYQGQCSTGPQQCCNSVQDSSVPQVAQLLGSVGLQLGAGIPIGVTCSPVTVIGAAGGSSCSQQPVCCNDNSFNGVVAIGCTPINVAA